MELLIYWAETGDDVFNFEIGTGYLQSSQIYIILER